MFKEDYPEIYDGTSSLVDTLIKERLSTVDRKIDERVGRVEEKASRGKYLSVLDSDDEVGKEWRAINKDPEFIASLEEIEPYTGIKKYDLLMDSWNRMDYERTLRFFKDFKAARKGSSPEKTETQTATMKDWRQFTQDMLDGKYQGREVDAEREEARLLKALTKRGRR
jgi:hypothetical protein